MTTRQAPTGADLAAINKVSALPPEQQQQAVDNMSPRDREEFYTAVERAGAQDSGILGGIIDTVLAGARAQQRSEEYSQRTVKDASSDTQYVQGLNNSDAHYQGVEHAELTRYVTNNMNPDQVGELSDEYHKLSQFFTQSATRLNKAMTASEAEWEGEAGDSARKFVQGLSTWSDGNGQNATIASETIYQQGNAAATAKNTMPEEVPFSWQEEMTKWAGNPLTMVTGMQDSIETYKQSQEAHAQAAEVMNTYDKELYQAASKQPVFAEPPKFDAGSGSGELTQPKPGEVGGIGGNIPPGGGGTDASGYGGSIPPGGGGGSIPPGGGSGSGGGGSIPPGGGGGAIPPLAPGRNTGVGTPIGSTSPSGRPAPTPVARGGNNRGGTSGYGGGMGAMPMGGMGGGGFGPGGSSEYNSKIGRGGGFGPGGGAGAAGPGSAPGSGAQSGMAKPGGVGGMAPGGAAAAGAAGGRGSGMGGGAMGAGGRGGQGGEDQEHQRPSYLLEGDPDSVFGTDERTAPPVIGE